ncbi:MAG: DUF1269 domain-containing protein [Burkholderiales bacterium]|nr:DUF1269 domain-containing protein [Burkholderiales bacterium]
MRHRIYWLLPDLKSARQVMDELLLARIEHRHLHFLARPGLDLSGLHEASALQSSDLISSAQRGLCVGAALGAAAGAMLAAYAMLDDLTKPAIVGALAAAGAFFGAWSASLIGASVPSRRLTRFQSALDSGQILLMADVPHRRVPDVEALLHTSHPNAHFEGHEPNVPAFP